MYCIILELKFKTIFTSSPFKINIRNLNVKNMPRKSEVIIY